MSSFLEEVLQSARIVEMDDLKEKITEFSKSVYTLKCEVEKEIEEVYANFSKLPDEGQVLLNKLKVKQTEIDTLYEKIETKTKKDLKNSTGELKALSSSLHQATLMLHEVNQLVQLDNELKDASRAQKNGEYLETAKKLQKVQKLLDDLRNKEEVEIYKALKKEKTNACEHFLLDMMDCWKMCLKWEERVSEKYRKRVCLKVDTSRLNEIEHMFQALTYLKCFDYELSKFGNKIMKFILLPLIVYDGSVEILNDLNTAVLDVETITSSNKPNYETVLINLRKVFKFLSTYLSLETEPGASFLNKLSKVISDEFCENLIKNCLSDTVPNHSNDLQSFKVVAADAEQFHEELKEIGFLDESNKSILEYAANIDTLFANKVCEMHLKNARDIMKKNLYDMVQVGSSASIMTFSSKQNAIENDCFHENESTENENIGLQPDIKLSDYTFHFPQCYISKSTLVLLDLIYFLMDEAVRSVDLSAVRLFYTARKIIELYCAVVPIYHSVFLETIPQQVALFHNNCMFLAHHLITLGTLYKEQLPPVLSKHTITFVDQVQKLRELGTSVFLKYMQGHRKQILDILRESGLATLGEDSKLPPSIEKSIKQCHHQMTSLQTVWKDVLPSNVYCKAMGCLMNAFVEELITRVVTVEDIPAHVATLLADVFKIVIDRAPLVFQDPSEVHSNVKKWQKFHELVFILQASLTEIQERWADGKGPLAHEFKANEVKQLIRALFQNNKRRSAILAVIK